MPGQIQGQPGPVQGYGLQGYQAGPQGQPGQPGYPLGSQPGVSQSLPNQGMPLPPGQGGQLGPVVQGAQTAQMAQREQGKPAKPARRGFLDTIREWFGLNS